MNSNLTRSRPGLCLRGILIAVIVLALLPVGVLHATPIQPPQGSIWQQEEIDKLIQRYNLNPAVLATMLKAGISLDQITPELVQHFEATAREAAAAKVAKPNYQCPQHLPTRAHRPLRYRTR